MSATPSVEFYRLLGSLADDVVYAHFHWHLVQELRTSLHERPLVAAQSNVFWYLTTRAHSATTVQLLSRAFDQEQSSLHLAALLEIVLENVEMFSNESFKSRMAGNPFSGHLLKDRIPPARDEVQRDLDLCRASDPMVKKLIAYRSSHVAHRSMKLSRAGTPSLGPKAPTDSEIETLLVRAKTMLNRYSYYFAAETHSTNLPGKDDYKYIFSSVEAAVTRGRRSDA